VGIGLLFDVAALGVGEALAQGGGALFTPLDRRVQRQLGGRHPPRRPDIVHRVGERGRDLLVGGFPAQDLGQEGLGAGHLDQRRVLVERDTDAARLFGQRLEDRLAHPPHGIGDELHSVLGIEFLDRLEQPLVSDRDQFGQVQSVPLVFLHVGNDETQVGGDQSLGSHRVALLGSPREPGFLGRIGDHGKTLNVAQVLVER
jgi:hypothetical protein